MDTPLNTCHLGDCMEAMKGMEDKSFSLAIVDPPYGIGHDGGSLFRIRMDEKNTGVPRIPKHLRKGWDKETPPQLYFDELRRVSRNQIIWGGNYFTDKIKTPSMGWVYWDKRIGGNFSDGELAWTSFHKALRSYSCHKWTGGEDYIHPTQKPISLYKWLLKNYAKPGDTILDTHVGSGSIRIACHEMGFPFEGWEIDKDYHEAQEKRFQRATAQPELFTPQETQDSLYG